MRPLTVTLLSLTFALLPFCVSAEQKVTAGDYEVHYIVIPTTFLQPEIASQYRLIRGEDRALVNVSALDSKGAAVRAEISGTTTNLLGQEIALDFSEVTEGSAIYYLAVFRHGNEEHQLFRLVVSLPDGEEAEIEFRQKLYWEP